MAQSVKRLTFGFGSDHDLMVSWVHDLSRALCWQHGACLGFSLFLSLSLSASPQLAHTLSKYINEP